MKIALGHVADIQTGPFGSQLHSEDYVSEGTPIITVENIGSRNIDDRGAVKVSSTDLFRLSKYVMKPGDVIFSRVGSVDRCSLVSNKEDGWLFSGRCLRVRAKDINPVYLYYYLTQPKVKQKIRNIAVGATMPSINTEILSNLMVDVPDKKTQSAIANALSPIDELIHLNFQINDYLVGIARSLYGDYLTSEDYQLMPLSYCASINTDTIGEKYNLDHINYLDTGNICEGHVTSYQLLSSKDTIPSRARRIVKQRDIVYSTVRPNQKHFGLLISIPENCIVSTGFSVVRSNDPHVSNEMLYLELTSSETIDYLQSIAESSTSTYPSIRADDLGEIKVPVGKNSDKLIDILKKIFDAVNNNDCTNEKLKDIRDFLLPKLISGEIDVSNIDLGC